MTDLSMKLLFRSYGHQPSYTSLHIFLYKTITKTNKENENRE